MSKTRNNHYVPQWYQEGFFERGRNTLAYLDTNPRRIAIKDGRTITERALFDAPTSRAFQQRDLYSTFFGTSINDEIERYLFGNIDTKGSKAIKAFTDTDHAKWHRYFQTLFEYIDVQKIRTPKGLDWLKAQYPALSQNDLMFEMQSIRMMHCTIWAEAVREIVSAEESDVKFIVSDHPITIYNHATAPNVEMCAYPNDPLIALKASQTIFPLNRNFCLILTNLEYARDPSTNPIEKRTFARNFRQSVAKTDAFIRTRKLSSKEVTRINYILKARARRYIAAGRKEWLYPEATISERWSDLRQTLLPSNQDLWNFGGEIYVQYESGHVHYQDEFGRTEQERDFLKKALPKASPRAKDACGCGSGKCFAECCKSKPIELRPTWTQHSIRERNLMLQNGIVNVLGLNESKDWVSIRRNLTDDQISKIYLLYQGLWPRETDLFQLLPKPDGVARAVYTGSIHPTAITDYATAAALYFGELIIQHPFLNPGSVKKDFSPVENPKAFRQEFLKSVIFFLTVMPLVEVGAVNLVPDPCDFDVHLRDQMWHMAKSRTAGLSLDRGHEPQIDQLMKDDAHRGILSMSRDMLRAQLSRVSPGLNEAAIEKTLDYMNQVRERDPLAVLQEDSFSGGEKGGLFNFMKLAPNFEITMYLAQATGSCIVTDSPFRWTEINRAINQRGQTRPLLIKLSQDISSADFAFPQDTLDIAELAYNQICIAYPDAFRDVFKYLLHFSSRGQRPNREAQLAGRFKEAHVTVQAQLKKNCNSLKIGKLSALFPFGGIQDNTVNRLLLMSGSDKYLPNVPMAFYIESVEKKAALKQPPPLIYHHPSAPNSPARPPSTSSFASPKTAATNRQPRCPPIASAHNPARGITDRINIPRQ